MDIKEFSAEFDILYNNIMSNIAPGLTEYEKSVFLTQAQEQLVKDIYSGQYKGEAFENSEEVREYLKSLIQTTVLENPTKISSEFPDEFLHYTVKVDAQKFWFIIFESAVFSGDEPCTNGKKAVVKPILYDAYWSIMRNPFKGPNKNRVLRINQSEDTMELISKYEVGKYLLSFLKRPDAIILVDLENEGISINGETAASTCKLPEILHRMVLERAVLLAKKAWGQSQE